MTQMIDAPSAPVAGSKEESPTTTASIEQQLWDAIAEAHKVMARVSALIDE